MLVTPGGEVGPVGAVGALGVGGERRAGGGTEGGVEGVEGGGGGRGDISRGISRPSTSDAASVMRWGVKAAMAGATPPTPASTRP